jgi:hypothetical protein
LAEYFLVNKVESHAASNMIIKIYAY